MSLRASIEAAIEQMRAAGEKPYAVLASPALAPRIQPVTADLGLHLVVHGGMDGWRVYGAADAENRMRALFDDWEDKAIRSWGDAGLGGAA